MTESSAGYVADPWVESLFPGDLVLAVKSLPDGTGVDCYEARVARMCADKIFFVALSCYRDQGERFVWRDSGDATVADGSTVRLRRHWTWRPDPGRRSFG